MLLQRSTPAGTHTCTKLFLPVISCQYSHLQKRYLQGISNNQIDGMCMRKAPTRWDVWVGGVFCFFFVCCCLCGVIGARCEGERRRTPMTLITTRSSNRRRHLAGILAAMRNGSARLGWPGLPPVAKAAFGAAGSPVKLSLPPCKGHPAAPRCEDDRRRVRPRPQRITQAAQHWSSPLGWEA